MFVRAHSCAGQHISVEKAHAAASWLNHVFIGIYRALPLVWAMQQLKTVAAGATGPGRSAERAAGGSRAPPGGTRALAGGVS